MKTLEQLGISPAPWKSYFSASTRVFDAENMELCDSDGVYSKGDAILIAAAPELYEALAAMLSCVEKEAPFTAGSGMSVAIDMARKAIKKAGGEE